MPDPAFAKTRPELAPLGVSPASAAAAQLAELLRDRRFAVLTGAGISTDSGIPDYRGPTTKHIARNPIKHDAFVRDATARQRYWARASRGFGAVADARPNAGHRALAALGALGRVSGVITQNVDGLHHAAGSRHVTELHGSLHRVVCLACREAFSRKQIQEQIAGENPGWIRAAQEVAPDGDAEIALRALTAFREPRCVSCGGNLMPDVVFFGGCVPAERAAAARRLVEEADGLLVVGSSLTVYSGYRFVRQADKLGVPIAILTLGETRGHRHAALAIDAPIAAVLPATVELCRAPR